MQISNQKDDDVKMKELFDETPFGQPETFETRGSTMPSNTTDEDKKDASWSFPASFTAVTVPKVRTPSPEQITEQV